VELSCIICRRIEGPPNPEMPFNEDRMIAARFSRKSSAIVLYDDVGPAMCYCLCTQGEPVSLSPVTAPVQTH